MTIHITVNSPTSDKQALECLFQNIGLVVQNKDLILSTPQYYNIHIQGVGVYALYILTLKLFLGDLLQLWEKTAWKQEGNYFYHTTGSPLSGSNCSSFWSQKEGFSHEHLPSIGVLLKPACLLVNNGTTEQKTNYVPIDSPKRIISKLSIFDMVERLKISQTHD